MKMQPQLWLSLCLLLGLSACASVGPLKTQGPDCSAPLAERQSHFELHALSIKEGQFQMHEQPLSDADARTLFKNAGAEDLNHGAWYSPTGVLAGAGLALGGLGLIIANHEAWKPGMVYGDNYDGSAGGLLGGIGLGLFAGGLVGLIEMAFPLRHWAADNYNTRLRSALCLDEPARAL